MMLTTTFGFASDSFTLGMRTWKGGREEGGGEEGEEEEGEERREGEREEGGEEGGEEEEGSRVYQYVGYTEHAIGHSPDAEHN